MKSYVLRHYDPKFERNNTSTRIRISSIEGLSSVSRVGVAKYGFTVTMTSGKEYLCTWTDRDAALHERDTLEDLAFA